LGSLQAEKGTDKWIELLCSSLLIRGYEAAQDAGKAQRTQLLSDL